MKKTQGFILASVAIASMAIGAFFFLTKCSRRKEKHLSIDFSKLQIEEVEGVVKLIDIVAWFKSLNLQAEKDTPFMIDGERVKELIDNAPDLTDSVFAGVYSETSETLKCYKAFRGEAFDKELKDVLAHATSDNPIVVLH